MVLKYKVDGYPHANSFIPMHMLLYKCKFLQFNETAVMYSCMCFIQNSVHAQSVHTHAASNAALRDQIVLWPLASDAAFSRSYVIAEHFPAAPGHEGNPPERTSSELVLGLVLLRLLRDPVHDAIFALSCQLWN